jgi:hypothetical protein
MQNSRQHSSWGAVLTDIAQHLPSSYGTMYDDGDKITHGHETTHGINSHLRNYFNETGQKANGFYVLEDRGVIVVEPRIRKSQVAAFVPQVLRGPRFGMYITGQTAWDDRPLYVWDEWVSYTNGGAVGIDLADRGMWHYGSRDAVVGQLEFTVYAIATAMAVERHDPEGFAANDQLREFLAWNAKRAMDGYRRGAEIPDFHMSSQGPYYQALLEHPDAEPLRAFVRRLFGDPWTRRVLFGEEGDDPDGGEGGGGPDDPDGGEGGGGPDGPDDGGGNDDVLPGDADADGVPDDLDLCSGTPPGARVWKYGEWIGCAAGQYRDADR